MVFQFTLSFEISITVIRKFSGETQSFNKYDHFINEGIAISLSKTMR